MVTMMSAKLTKGGRTTVPEEIRTAPGFADGARAYWTIDDRRAWLSATPGDLLEVTSGEEFRTRLAVTH